MTPSHELPPVPALCYRLLGIFISVSLIVSPWLFAVNTTDPFLNQAWLTLGLAFLATIFLAATLPFYGPRLGQIPFLKGLAILWVAVAISSLTSSYSVSMRFCIILGSQLVLLSFLRVSQTRRDVKSLVTVTIMSGTGMSLYAILQALHLDPINWGSYQVVGTLSNPNFFGAYILTTGLLTFFTALRAPLSLTTRIFLWGSSFLHLIVLFLAKCSGAFLCLAITFLACIFPIHRRFRSLVSGRLVLENSLVLTVLVTLFLGGACLAVRNFPWAQLADPPLSYFPVVTRLLLWDMGFSLFMESPIFGMGPGSTQFLLTNQRPQIGTFLGLSLNNNDPHSILITLLGETGLMGLFGFVALFLSFVRVQSWYSHRTWVSGSFLSLRTMGPAVVLGDTPVGPIIQPPAGSPGEVAQSGKIRPQGGDIPPEVIFIPAMALCLDGTFNNVLSMIPLTNLLLLLTSFHQTTCLKDIRWYRRFTPLFLPYLLLPFLAGPLAWYVLANYHSDVTRSFEGGQHLARKQYSEAQRCFEQALRDNPRSLQAMWGLAAVFEEQKRLRQAREMLIVLDQQAPNVSATRFHLARIFLEENMLLEAHRWATLNVAWSTSPSGFEILGRILLAEGRIDEARMAFAEGLRYFPTWLEEERVAVDSSRFHLASYAIDNDDLGRGRELLSAAQPRMADNPDFCFLKGLLEYKSGNATGALALFEAAALRKPDDPRYANAIGFLLVEMNADLTRAKKLLQTAYTGFKAQNPPNLMDILSVTHSLGKLSWKLGELDKAQELLHIAFSETPAGLAKIKTAREQDLRQFLKETSRSAPEISP